MNLVAARSVLFFDMEVIIWVYRCFFSLVDRAGTLGNSWNLHKSKMAAMDSGFASGWDIIQLMYLQSCVTLLYQIMFTRGIYLWGQFGDSRLIYRSNVKFKVIHVVVAPNRQQTKSISLLVSAYFDGFTMNCCILTVYIDS